MSSRVSAITDDGLVTRPANGHDRRRDRTRRALATVMRELIAEQGLTGLRIGEVARRAGVSAGSFYNHFGSLDELVEAVIADALQTLTVAMTTRRSIDEDPAQIVGDSMRRFIGLVDDDPELARFIVQLDRADALMSVAVYPEGRRALSDGVTSGRFRDIDIESTLVGVLGGALAIMRAMLVGTLPSEAMTGYVETVLRGLGLPAPDARAIARQPLRPLATAASSASGPDDDAHTTCRI